jgi:polysaccharide export outer membrane protein
VETSPSNLLDCHAILSAISAEPELKTVTAPRLLLTVLLVLATALSFCARAQEHHPEYRIRPGDTISIAVFQNADLKLDARVTENGNISYPLIGIIPLGGMSVTAAEQSIAKALADGGFIKNPQVTITVKSMRGNVVSVLGQVGKAGRFELETVNLRVTDLLTMAGGIASTGADTAILSGVRGGKPFRAEIDIVGIFVDNRPQDDLVVADGDMIYVHRAPVFYIYGEVTKPGSQRIERNMTVRKALAAAGGPTSRGTERRLILHRRGAGGAMETLSPDLNDPVRPDDVFYVRESLF